MNKVLMSLLFGSFILTGSAYAQNPPPVATTAVATPVAVKPAHHDRHPEIHKAMRKLKEAKEDLDKAARDFGGHKVKAIAAINQALAELHAGLEFDK